MKGRLSFKDIFDIMSHLMCESINGVYGRLYEVRMVEDVFAVEYFYSLIYGTFGTNQKLFINNF